MQFDCHEEWRPWGDFKAGGNYANDEGPTDSNYRVAASSMSFLRKSCELWLINMFESQESQQT